MALLPQPAHALTSSEAAEQIGGNLDVGLTDDEARARLEKHGRNELHEIGGANPVKILVAQVANAMTLVLLLAMSVSFGIKSYIEGSVIAVVIALNIVVGFIQEYRAEETMSSLRSLSSPTANAVRAGRTDVVPTAEIVPGDMVEMSMGDTVPADIRLIEAVNFDVDEALLTGESIPVRKDADCIFPDDTGPGDRFNIAFSSSVVTKGRARGIVFATGKNTEIGNIAEAIRQKNSRRRQVKRKPDGSAKPYRYAEAGALTITDALGRFLGVNVGTPLQKKLSKLALLLFWIAVACAILVLGVNGFSNQTDVITYAVATGLSMIPASLVVVLTITMAAGTKKMVERNVIVRNLRSLEALGAVTDICSDKTGTLTQGRMVAKTAWIPDYGTVIVGNSREPFNPTDGELHIETEDLAPAHFRYLAADQHVVDFLNVASLANLATVQKIDNEWYARGDPTEVAIQVFASRFDWNRLKLANEWRQVAEFPFDSEMKCMSVICEDIETQTRWVFTKGAVERVLECCNIEQGPILEKMEMLASQGLRVLALASRVCVEPISMKEDLNRNEFETGLTFRGLIGLYDPPRPESAESVKRCHEAGIQVHMLTGDHVGTAKAIALEVGILPRLDGISREVADAMIMTASRFDHLSDAEIDALPVLPLVVARCAPNTKVRMIEALHRRKRFAAMTGDGVNDSPSLKQADVGIAMGSGSDVAKNVSDIVLTDDNFASILNAIEEGRRMFDNIQKFILHLLAENIAQACTLLIGLIFKDDVGLSVFPLAPVEVLWVIMITSGLPDMGLGFEAAAPDIMKRPPQSRGVFTYEVLIDMLVYGLWTALLCVTSFVLVLTGLGSGDLGEDCNNTYSPECDLPFRARATCFACLTWFALFLAWEMVDMRRSFFRMHETKRYFTQWMIDIWSNQFLFWAIIAGFITIFPTLYIPVINRKVFKHEGISWEWSIVFIEALLFFIGIEAWKWAKRVYFRRQGTVQDLESKIFEEYYKAQ